MNTTKKRAIALGFFDGIHLGHQALLRKTMERAGEYGLTPGVFTFDRSPREFVTGRPVPLVTTVEERRQAVERLFPGMEFIVAPFDRRMMELPWEDFIRMLEEDYGAGWLVAGHDFRFGARNEGSTELLLSKTAERGIGCDIIPAVLLDGEPVSSTRIRAVLAKGDTEEAGRLLGRPFSIMGVVEHGQGLGHRLGTPTLNTVPTAEQLIPAYGVYVTCVEIDGQRLPAVTNIGVRPTVTEDQTVVAESHLLEKTAELYGKSCRVEFLHRIRPERKFDDLAALQKQIREDAEAAKGYFRRFPL